MTVHSGLQQGLVIFSLQITTRWYRESKIQKSLSFLGFFLRFGQKGRKLWEKNSIEKKHRGKIYIFNLFSVCLSKNEADNRTKKSN